MNSSLYIGATGMKGLAEGMSVTTNNLANVSTVGYKKQDMLFSDLISQTQASMGNWWNAQEDSRVAIGQVGMGLQVEAVRTSYSQGGLESTNTMTDMAINGKGFFQVTDGTNTFYTRAGDFRSDNEGVWRTPSGLALNGYPIDASGNRGELSQVQVLATDTMPAKATGSISLTMNVRPGTDQSVSTDNPFFSLLDQYNGAAESPISSSAYTSSQSMTIYDSEGNARTVTAYFDGAPSDLPNSRMEFLIAADPAAVLNADGIQIGQKAGETLMSGVLEFDETGKLINVAAFTPTTANSKNLNDWQAATLTNGVPTFSLDGNPITMDFGLTATGDWQNGGNLTAAQIGTNGSLLPNMGQDAIRAEYPVTGYPISALANSYKQDGYSAGNLSNMSLSSDGIVTGYFTNGESMDLWEIPVARFTSEDGLYREGGNLFSWTEEAGSVELGTAGTENYGTIEAYNIETSNVDMATEMVNMIINQRGFQSNSKVVTTADQMLQKAMELKR